jgi:hypothetical protein
MKKLTKKNILIFGAGSLGNHMAYASRKLNLNVDVTDISTYALDRMKTQIFPKRYGYWDSKINLVPFNQIFKTKKKYDLIIVGTPPKTHFQIFQKVTKKIIFKNILIEKPLTNYASKNYNDFNDKNGRVFCGYNHSLSLAFEYFFKILKKNKKNVNKIFVEWKEGWSGILKAHPWLKNEFQSYLGNLKEGGGALQEHSHGLHLLILIMNLLKKKINKKNINFFSLKKKNKNKQYDCYTNVTLISQNTFIKYETDLISKFSRKRISIETDDKIFIVIFNYKPNLDAVIIKKAEKILKIKFFKKNRSTEFQREINHIIKINNQNYLSSPINFRNGVNVMRVIRKILKKN